MTAEKRALKDMKRAYVTTMTDIVRYIRQTGTISIEAVKKFIGWNYFKNTNPVRLWTYEEEDGKYSIVTMDMFDLDLWLAENYGLDIDMLDSIEDELSYYTTISVRLN